MLCVYLLVHIFQEYDVVLLLFVIIFLYYVESYCTFKTAFALSIIIMNIIPFINQFSNFTDWTTVRGLIMLIVIKFCDIVIIKEQTMYSSLNYYMNPSTFIFGPLCTNLHFKQINHKYFFKIVHYMVLIYILYIYSSCIPQIIHYHSNDELSYILKLVKVYFMVQSYRFSAYFVNYLGEVLLFISTNRRLKTVSILSIEFPISMSHAVINWNRPLNQFYKNCMVYRIRSQPFDFADKSLYGFDAKITLILLTIGISMILEKENIEKYNKCVIHNIKYNTTDIFGLPNDGNAKWVI
ncbi:hypothetical protein A3Q56_03769 [Intoshia linei]|uniref:Uncharacterized protein n=1 Tax=Intoshia linei TaxID=1819745 RepID=A0A177B4K9_9BILA|nr:hypothetical protein A3Q56_03769 [Intoshia linei]